MEKKEVYRKRGGFITEVSDSSKYFYFFDNSYAKNLRELMHKIKTISDDWFRHYVNENKNDFANWIRYCINDEFLYEEILPLKSRSDIAMKLEEYLNDAAAEEKNEAENAHAPAHEQHDESVRHESDAHREHHEHNESKELHEISDHHGQEEHKSVRELDVKKELEAIKELDEQKHTDPVMPLWKSHLHNLVFLLVIVYILMLIVQMFIMNRLLTQGVVLCASLVIICCSVFYHRKILKNSQGHKVLAWMIDFISIMMVLLSFVYILGNADFAWNLFPWFLAVVSLFILNLVASHI